MDNSPSKIYLLSGGVGSSGEYILKTILAQFPDSQIELVIRPNIRNLEQLEPIVMHAAADGELLVHTMVNTELRQAVKHYASSKGIKEIDLMDDLITNIGQILGQEPSGVPGLYRQLQKEYFERVSAIDFTLEHDDGLDPEGWTEADAVLVGPSRAGKTPISMYLAVLGWKIANYPLVPEIPIHQGLFDPEIHRVIGLSIDPLKLVAHRQQRQRRMGTITTTSDYTDPTKVFEEMENAEKLYKQAGFRIIDVTNKPIETCADEIIRLLPRSEDQ